MDRGIMKYVALDIGNVLVHADFSYFIEDLSKQFNMSLDEAKYFMNRSQKLHDLGLTTMRDEIRNHLNVRSEILLDELVGSWNDCIDPEKLILDKLHSMQNDGLQIALLSNVGPEHAKRMEHILGYKGFIGRCVKYFSCYVGARKPTSIYYQSFLQLYPEWKGCGYIDDLQENLDTSKQFGFRTFCFNLEQDMPRGPNFTKHFDRKIEEIEEFILA